MQNPITYTAKKISSTFRQYGVDVKLKPVAIISQYEWIFSIKLKGGTKIKSVLSTADDVSIQLNIPPILVFRQESGLFCKICFIQQKNNSFTPLLEHIRSHQDKTRLTISLGYDMTGQMTFDNLSDMPHLLCTGATGSGKSIFLRCLLLSLTCTLSVQDVNLIIFDVGGKTLSIFEGLPHLSYPIVKDLEQCIYVIKAVYEEMEFRLKLNDIEVNSLPAIVCVIDEFVYLSELCTEEFQKILSDILRRGRKVKIQVVLAAQCSSKSALNIESNNITSRIAFKCASYHESLTAIGIVGAEKLQGNGEMFYISNGMNVPERIQGSYISDEECISLINQIKAEQHNSDRKFVIPSANPVTLSVMNEKPKPTSDKRKPNPNEELAQIIMWTIENSEISVNSLKKAFSIGNRANDFIDTLCTWGIISELNSKKPRKVLPRSMDDLSEKVITLLIENGFSSEEINVAFDNRNADTKSLSVQD